MIHGAVMQATETQINEQRGVRRSWSGLQTPVNIVLQSLTGGGMQGHEAVLPELACFNGKHFCSLWKLSIFRARASPIRIPVA